MAIATYDFRYLETDVEGTFAPDPVGAPLPYEVSGNADGTDDTVLVGEPIFVGLPFRPKEEFIYVGRDAQNGVIYENADGDRFYLSNQDFGGPATPDILIETYVTCFAAGTLIATPSGEARVETLSTGDTVLTADGRPVPVKWIGRQTLHKLFTPSASFCPVRIGAGALGAGRPHTDLVVTADHGVVVDDVIVNAGALVNGTTIVRVPLKDLDDRVTYYHIETENHEIILANGTSVETFVDNTRRRAFDNYGEYLTLFGGNCREMVELSYPRAMSRRQLPSRIEAMLNREPLSKGTRLRV